jgi:hypothetical protein
MASPSWEAVEALQEHFNERRGDLYREYPDRWLIWTAGGVVAELGDELEAFIRAYEDFEPGTFVVDQATEQERVLTVSFNALR